MLGRVEEARSALATAAPRGRAAGAPLAAALASFEAGLQQARSDMGGWSGPPTEHEWRRCGEALDEALRRAERLRLEASPASYEELYGMLGDIMEPLDVFALAERRLRGLPP